MLSSNILTKMKHITNPTKQIVHILHLVTKIKLGYMTN